MKNQIEPPDGFGNDEISKRFKKNMELPERLRLAIKSRNELKRYLESLTNAVGLCLKAFDTEMGKPSDIERGKRIAKICNALELENDQARYFGLGIDYRKDKKEFKQG